MRESKRAATTQWMVAALFFLLVVMAVPLRGQQVWLRQVVGAVYWEYTSLVYYWSDTAVLLLLVAVAVWWLRERPISWAAHWAILVPLVLLPFLALLSAQWAALPSLAFYFGARLLLLLLLYLAVVVFRPSARLVQWSLVACLLLQAAVALGQFALQHDLGLRFLGELPLAPRRGFTSILIVNGRDWLRAYGLTPHPNILGGLLMALLLALVPAYLQARGKLALFWLVALGLGVAGLLVSFSRAAWLGLGVGGLLLLVGVWLYQDWRVRYGRKLLLPIISAVVVLAVVVWVQRDLFLARLVPSATYTESRSLDDRQALGQASLYLIGRAPLLGTGAGNFSVVLEQLSQPEKDVLLKRFGTVAQPVHNLPLLLTAELGPVGGLLWLWLMLAPPVIAWQQWRRGQLTLWGLALSAVLVALALVDLLDFYSWGWQQGRLLRWLCLALWSVAVMGDR